MIIKKVFLLLTLSLISLCLMAVELPALPSDPVFHHGILPNGVSWYVAVNKSTKGLADFVLVQKCGIQIADSISSPKQVAKELLARLPHFQAGSPQKFMTSRGAAPDRNGFVQVTDDATIYRFSNILLTDDKAVTDSTLLMLFDIVNDQSTKFQQKWYSPSDQAIIISGDVDPEKIKAKLYYMSLMVNPRKSIERPKYKWVNSQAPSYKLTNTPAQYSTLSINWRMPRTPYEYMNTIQPAVFEMVVNELGYLASTNIKDYMSKSGLAVADVRWDYLSSSSTTSDELFTMSMSVLNEDLDEAVKATAGTFSAICKGKTGLREFKIAKKDYVASLAEQIAFPLKKNSDYVDKAISSFLYNASLASVKEKYTFYNSRQISDTLELRLFNNIASAMLSDRENLKVECNDPSRIFTAERLRNTFESSWDSDSWPLFVSQSCESAYAELPAMMEKIKATTRVDKASGSFIWKFTNGFTVIYKKMPTENNLFYSLSLNGGYGNIPNLVQGEGGFMSDYLSLCRINGVSGNDFFRALQEDGIYMRSNVALSEMSVSGVSPIEKVPQTMNALVSVFNNRENNRESFEPYLKDRKLDLLSRGEGDFRTATIDSIMCPDNKYTVYQNINALTPEFLDKADRFYKLQSEKMDDGVLVLVGDMDEDYLKKMLTGYVGHFKTSRRAFYRTTYRYQPISGTSIYTVDGDYDGIDVVMSAMYPLSAENDLAVRIAGMVLNRRLSEAMADTGMYLDVSAATTIFPQERINVMVSARTADSDGFASGVIHTGPIKALSVMRSCFSELATIEVSAEELAIYKDYVKGQLLVQQHNPAWWLDVISRRYIQGKDLYSNITAKLDIITTEKIKHVLSALSSGSRVEYVTKHKDL